MTAPLLQISRLTKRFPGHRRNRPVTVLDDLSFHLERGECLGITGENGAGKTTLIRCLLGLAPIDGGAIDYNVVRLSGLSDREWRPFRQKIQIVWQQPDLYLNPHMRVSALIAEPLENFRSGSRKKRSATVFELVRRVGLDEHILGRYPHELSGGQCQRVALARALAPGPEIVMFDEAISSLDVPAQVQMIRLIDGLRRQMGLSCLFVSHDLQVVQRLCTRILVLQDGRLHPPV